MKIKHRILLAAAIGGLLFVPASTSLASSAGRIYSRCINSCNAVRQACTSRCAPDCLASYPNDSAARSACISQCKDTCISEDKDCKDRCQAIKDGTSPSEP